MSKVTKIQGGGGTTFDPHYKPEDAPRAEKDNGF